MAAALPTVLLAARVPRTHQIVISADSGDAIAEHLTAWAPSAGANGWGAPPPFYHRLALPGLPTVAKDDSGKKWTWSCEGGKNRPMMSGNRFTVIIEEVELEEMGSTIELPDAAAGMKWFRITIGSSGMHKVNQAMVQAIEDELIKSKSS